jgi:hypothetical protein
MMFLTGPHGDRAFADLAWILLVQLALDHGWRPTGPLPPEATGEPFEEEYLVERAKQDRRKKTPETTEVASVEAESPDEIHEAADDAGPDLDDEVLRALPQYANRDLSHKQKQQLAQELGALSVHANYAQLRRYFGHRGYRVSAQDANALADALAKALPDIPNHDALTHKTVGAEHDPNMRFVLGGTAVSAYEWFSGHQKTALRSLVEFCREGEFAIW